MTDTFEIRLRIHDEAELYSSFDEERSTISDDAVDYIFMRYKEKEFGEKMRIRIISDEDIDMDNLKNAFEKYLSVERLQLKKEKKTNAVKQLWMFGVGVLFIAVGLYAASVLPALLGEIISTIGAFAMWEAASIWIVENPRNRLKRKWIDSLMQTELTYEKHRS